MRFLSKTLLSTAVSMLDLQLNVFYMVPQVLVQSLLFKSL